MPLKNPPFFYLFLVFVLVNLVDVISAMFVLPGESNLIYLLTGSMVYVTLGKLLLIGVIWYYYQRNIYPSTMLYFVITMVLVLGSLVIGFAAYGNISAAFNPELLEYAASLSVSEKAQGFVWFISIFYFLPFGITLLAFWIYDKSLKYVSINKGFFKKRKWWQP